MMKKVIITFLILSATLVAMPSFAQESDKASQKGAHALLGFNMVSMYYYRGHDFGGVSLLPAINVSRNGFSLTVFGSKGFESKDFKTIGLELGYQRNGLKALITDFWVGVDVPGFKSSYFKYGDGTTRYYEVSLVYDFKFMEVGWNTIFTGDDYNPVGGKRLYSSYFEVAAPFRIGEVDFRAHLGLSPWKSFYHKDFKANEDMGKNPGFNVVNTGIKAERTLFVLDKLAIPFSVQFVVNPYKQQAFLFAGVGLWL